MKTPITQNNFVVPYHIHNGVDSPKLNAGSTTFQGLTDITKATGSFAGASFAPFDAASVTVSVPGAKFGDFVLTSYSNNINSIIMFGFVSAADTIQVQFFNVAGAPIVIAAGTVYISVISNP